MTKRLLTDYIQAYSGALTPQECETLIARFEAATDRHETKRVENVYSFVQLDVTGAWPEVSAQVERIMNICYGQYQASLDIRQFWPSSYFHENLRMKRYLPGGRDGFLPHVDVMDQSTSNRFCTAILYLNDPGGGGETVFPDLGVTMSPEPGKLIIFPPLWTFPHAGMPPRSRPKYILHSYLWYPPAGELLASYRFDSKGWFTVTLANGQIWEQQDGSQLAHWDRLASQYAASISKGTAESYDLTIAGEGTPYKVRRVQ
jgi:prolyl 4-hydroxylase